MTDGCSHASNLILRCVMINSSTKQIKDPPKHTSAVGKWMISDVGATVVIKLVEVVV